MVEFNDYLYCAKICSAHYDDVLSGTSEWLHPSVYDGMSVGTFLESRCYDYEDLIGCRIECYANCYCEISVRLYSDYNSTIIHEYVFTCKFSVKEFYSDVLSKLV